MNLRFDGEVVVVTGAGAGMGRSHALELAHRGARVLVNDLGCNPDGSGSDPSYAEGVVAEIADAGGEALANTASVAERSGASQIIEQALDTWGRLDAVISNAGIIRDRLFEELDDSDIDHLIDTHLKGAFYICQHAYRHMMGAGGGRLVVITSTSGLCGGFGQANYAAAKMGQVGLVRSLAAEAPRYNVTVNAVAPGAWDTRMGTEATDTPLLTKRPQPAPPLVDVLSRAVVASRVTPMVVVLAHQSCAANGEIFIAIGGAYCRAYVAANDGWFTTEEVAPERLLEHLDDVRQSSPASEAVGDTIDWVNTMLQDRFDRRSRSARETA